MSERLILRLDPPGTAEAAWVVLDQYGRRAAAAGSGSLADAAHAMGERPVTVLVPGPAVLHTRVRLPIRQPDKLRQALPYSLEEQLAEDVEALHFAAGRPDRQGDVEVAVAAHERMRGWLARLRDAGIAPQAMYGDAQALAANPGSLTLVVEGPLVYLVPPSGPAQVFEGLPPEQVLELAEQALAEMPRHVLLYADGDADEPEPPWAERLRSDEREVDVHWLRGGATGRMAAGIHAQPGVDLLQGEYAGRPDYAARLRPWRAAAALLVLTAAASVTLKAIEYRQLGNALEEIDARIETVFRDTFGDRPVVDYRLQIEQELARLRAGGADPVLLETLAALGAALRNAEQTRVLAVSYRQGVVDLRLSAPDVDALEALRRELAEGGVAQAEIQAANPVDGAVEGRLRLSGGGA